VSNLKKLYCGRTAYDKHIDRSTLITVVIIGCWCIWNKTNIIKSKGQ